MMDLIDNRHPWAYASQNVTSQPFQGHRTAALGLVAELVLMQLTPTPADSVNVTWLEAPP